MNNYIFEYYQAIKDGSVIVGRWIILLYEYIVHGIENKEFYLDLKKANKAVQFIELFCHHSKGALAPQLIKLELWQKALISCIYGIVDENGVRQFREVLIVEGRKQGKTILASGIMEKSVYADGEYGADTYCLAPKLDQTDLVFSDFWASVSAEPELKNLTDKRKYDIYIPSTNTTVKRIAFSAKKSDGFNPHLVICDEIASWSGAPGLKQYEVMTSALGARKQPLIVSITTAGYENEGIYDELIKRSTRFLMGESKEKRLLPFLYMVDNVEKWNDLTELAKSLPNLGVSVSVDFMLNEIAIAEGSLSKRAEFITKYCNIKQNSSTAWLSANDVRKITGEELNIKDFENCYCVGGIDLSQTTDLTACCIVVEKAGQLYVFMKFFMPANKLEDATARDGLPYALYVQRGLLQLSGENFVDYRDCFNWFKELIETYRIYPLKIGYDRYSSQYLVNDMKEYGFHLDDVFQGENLTPVIREFEGIIKDGNINIGDNDLLKVHFLDAALKSNLETRRVRIVKINPTSHIDGAAAVLDALTVRQKWWSEIGGQLINEGIK